MNFITRRVSPPCQVSKGKDNESLQQLFRDNTHEYCDELVINGTEPFSIANDYHTDSSEAIEAAGNSPYARNICFTYLNFT
jgi:hypothetical protein